MPDGIARKSSSAAKALLGAELRIGVGQLTQRCRDNDTKSEVRNEKIERLNPPGFAFRGDGTIPSSRELFASLWTLCLTLRSCWHINRLAVLRQVATGESEKAYVQHDVGNYESVQVKEMLPWRGLTNKAQTC